MKNIKLLLIFLLLLFSNILRASDVEVKFKVKVPGNTPSNDSIYIYGNFNNFDPGPSQPPDSSDLVLQLNPFTGFYELTIFVKDRSTLNYLFTRGSIETIENFADSTERPFRTIFIESEQAPFLLRDSVESWTDFTLPPVPENGVPLLTFFNNSPQTSIGISWATDSSTVSKVYYGINDINENILEVTEHVGMIDKDDKLIHRARLSNLQPNTRYKYKVLTEGVYESDELSFTTADYSNEFLFVVLGDNRPGVSEGVLNGTINDQPNFVLHTGDLVQNGQKLSDWFVFFRNWESLLGAIPTMSIYGNHEEFVRLNDFFIFPANGAVNPDNEGQWYSFDYNNIHVIGLYSYDNYSPGSDQYNWLINDLNSIGESIDHIFVQIHEPSFTSGVRHGPNLQVREHLIPVFDEYKIDIVFFGHEHMYERSEVNGKPYITTGGAGSPLYYLDGGKNEYSIVAEQVFHYVRVFVEGKNIFVEMVRDDGSIGDRFEIIKNISIEVPSSTKLMQNYPNPFNSQTRIVYSILKPGEINLSLFNVLGQKIFTLEKGFKDVGTYESVINSNSLASGVYIYKLTTSEYEDAKKLILVK